jgi:hypothetical protein
MAKGRSSSTQRSAPSRQESLIFTDSFIGDLPENPWEALNHIACIITRYESINISGSGREEAYDSYITALNIIKVIAEANDIRINFPPLADSVKENVVIIGRFMNSLEEISLNRIKTLSSEERMNKLKNEIISKWKNTFAYEFSSGDLSRIQKLINELRSEISESTKFEDKYKSRLLRRLEKLQNELNKRVSSLDNFWGLIGDAGVVLGKLGTDAKPIVDRIREMVDIIWHTQARSEELSSNTPPALLGSHDQSIEEQQEGSNKN